MNNTVIKNTNTKLTTNTEAKKIIKQSVADKTIKDIIPESLSKQKEAFFYALTKERIIIRLTQSQIELMQEIHRQDIELIKMHKRLNKKVDIPQKYVKTKFAAAYLSVDPSFLTKAQNKIFIEGIHYFKPKDSNILRWNLEVLEEWLRTENTKEDDEILNQMFI